MKSLVRSLFITVVVLTAGATRAAPLGTAFTYQGKLASGGQAANGIYDFRFSISDSADAVTALAPPIELTAVAVTNGLFTATLDFGANVFTGDARWLEVAVRTNGTGGAYHVLPPRQLLTPAPYALWAGSVGALPSGAVGKGWGNTASGDGTVIGGGVGNTASENYSTISGGYGNAVTDAYVAIGGGSGNKASGECDTIAGGLGNKASDLYATIGGGYSNTATNTYATLGGGGNNIAGGVSSTVAGGFKNQALGQDSTVGGGYLNTASGFGATVPGGSNNRATGDYSFAAGQSAVASDAGSIVFTDSRGGDFASTVADEFAVRAFNGVRVQTDVGVHLNAVNRPLIVRDWDPFNSSAPNGKAGIGRWGLFMEPSSLVLGIPGTDIGPRSLEVARYQRDGSRQKLFGMDNQGLMTVVGNLRLTSPTTGATLVELGEGLDYAEGFDVAEAAKPAPGTVLVIDAGDAGKLAVSRKAYDRGVAGIVAGAHGLGSGVRLATGQFDCDVALAGRVYCNVDASLGAVTPGDLLTTSPTPGHAMRVGDAARAQGAVLGKAMQPLPAGERRQILVLVTLQ